MSELTLPLLLNTISKTGFPVGASYLSSQLAFPPATIGRLMKEAEDAGYLQQVSNKGRILTEPGQEYLRTLETVRVKEQAAQALIDTATSSTTEHLLEILQIRRLLEPYAASLASVNATDADIAEIENIVFEQIYEIRKGNLGSEQDLRLHLKLADISGMSAMYQILKLLLTENSIYVQFSSVSKEMNIQDITSHDDIVKAIQKRDSHGAEVAMRQHIDRLIESIKSFAAEQKAPLEETS